MKEKGWNMTLSLSQHCRTVELLENRKCIGETMLPVKLALIHERMGRVGKRKTVTE